MASTIIGKNIAELRKARGITQEALADVVGVTSQAVSKWESGGAPDIEFLPKIADFFEVSIDKLFNRNVNDYGDLIAALHNSIVELPESEKFEKALEYCLALEKSLFGSVISSANTFEPIEEIRKNGFGSYSQVLSNEGFTLMSLAEKLPYFLIMPEPPCGWKEKLGFNEAYIQLFLMLSDPDTLKALFLLYKRENKAFTPKLLEKNLGIPKEKAIQILDALHKFDLINTSEIELDDEIQKVYNFSPNAAFIAVLTLSNELIQRPKGFYYNTSCRDVPYLK